MDEILESIQRYGELGWAYLSSTVFQAQLAVIGLAFVASLLLARRIAPAAEARARLIKGMPGLLRFLVAFLRRMKWLLFFLILALAYLVTAVTSWPFGDFLIYTAMLLSGAWVGIAAGSNIIRSRMLAKLFAFAAWAYVAAMILGIGDDLAVVLDQAGVKIGTVRISILGALQTLLLIGGLLWVSFMAGNFLDQRIQSLDELTPSLRVLIGKVLRIFLVIIAVMIGMSSLGIDLTALTVLSGAVGVGIGFGLQKVVSNFISGIIILLDRSIKPGDTISLGETFGWIRELRARFVSVITRDGREFLIPNEDFITREVINWSFSDEYVRLDVPFGVSYDSDPHEVARIAIEAASSVERVNSNRNPPVCWLTAFGDSSLDFLLRFWIRDPQKGLTNVRGKVLMALWDAFKENGINIPYPHREVIVKTPVSVTRPD